MDKYHENPKVNQQFIEAIKEYKETNPTITHIDMEQIEHDIDEYTCEYPLNFMNKKTSKLYWALVNTDQNPTVWYSMVDNIITIANNKFEIILNQVGEFE